MACCSMVKSYHFMAYNESIDLQWELSHVYLGWVISSSSIIWDVPRGVRMQLGCVQTPACCIVGNLGSGRPSAVPNASPYHNLSMLGGY